MADPGIAIAAASLTIELIEGIVELYKVFAAVADMPNEYRYLQTRLLIEYSRLIDFRKAAGLIQKEADDLPASLKSDRLTLVAILTEMQVLMEGFRKMIKKYKKVDGVVTEDAKKKNDLIVDLVAEYDALSYDQKDVKKAPYHRRFWSKTKSVVETTKDVVINPKRFVWAFLDAEEFVKRLERLTELNDYLHELLHGREAMLLKECTQRSQLDIVMIKNSVDHLEHLFTAAMLLQERKSYYSPSSNSTREHNDKILASLAKSKQLKLAGDPDSFPADSPPAYSSTLKSTVLQYSQIVDIQRTAFPVEDGSKARIKGKLKAECGAEENIWVEWRAYKTTYDVSLKRHIPRSDQIKRVQQLVSLLKSEKPEEFAVPNCVGYFDDRGEVNDRHGENPAQFGLVFKLPQKDSMPKSLHHLLGLDEPAPSLTQRAALARKVATCVLYLHAISWLHHDIRSDSVIFLDPTDISKPLLSGFDYARPDATADQTTSENDKGDEKMQRRQRQMDLARHPAYQGPGRKPPYCKTFDIYGLGILLLEVALWQRIEDIVGYPREPNADGTEKVAEQAKIAESLQDDLEKADSYMMSLVRINFGDKYHQAVLTCIRGRKAFGIRDDEDEMDVFTGTKLQRGFTSLVVDALEEIRL